MKKVFAVPTVAEKLCVHFGHCEKLAIVETDGDGIVSEDYVTPPAHQPGVLPAFLARKGVNVIIAGGMGQKAQMFFKQNNIEVCVGAKEETPKELVETYLKGNLTMGENLCDH